MNKSIFKLRWIILLLAFASFLFSLPMLLVWQHVTTIRLAKENESLQEKAENLRVNQAACQIEVDAMLTQDYVEKTACEKLNMKYAKTSQVVFAPMRKNENVSQNIENSSDTPDLVQPLRSSQNIAKRNNTVRLEIAD
jgi:cell division protein FtsL